MLSELENRLAAALHEALPGATVAVGPPPAAGLKQQVYVHASGFEVFHRAGEDGESKRDAAFLSQRHDLTGDGHMLDFPLPETLGELAEVELSPGRFARVGDQCWLEGNLLRFYRAPTGPFSVLLRGQPALGYRETAQASATLAFAAFDESAAACDKLANTALAVLLSSFVGLDVLVLAEVPALGFSLRLLRPQLALQSLERNAVTVVDTAKLFQATLRLRLRGELETVLAQGTPEEEGRIKQLQGTLAVINDPRSSLRYTLTQK